MAILLFVHLTRHSSTASEQLSVFLRCQHHHRSTEQDACLGPPAADAYRQLGVSVPGVALMPAKALL
jgi:hypothetical protein